MAEHQVFLQAGTAQVQIAVFETGILQRVRLIRDDERRGLRAVHDLHLIYPDLDVAGRQLRILVLSFHDRSRNAEHILIAHFRDRLGQLLVKDELCDARAVPQVDEHQRAEITALGHPAFENDGLPGVGEPQLSIVMRTFHVDPPYS